MNGAEDLCLDPRLVWKFLLRRAWSDQNDAPTVISRRFFPLNRKESGPSLLGIFLSAAGLFGNQIDMLGAKGWKLDPESMIQVDNN